MERGETCNLENAPFTPETAKAVKSGSTYLLAGAVSDSYTNFLFAVIASKDLI